jgi:inhibitor of KinA
MLAGMRIERLGEKALILRDLPCPAYVLARELNGEGNLEALKLRRLQDGNSELLPLALEEAVASYQTVGLYFSQAIPEIDGLLADLESVALSLSSEDVATGRILELPVCYEMGEDLQQVGSNLNLSPEDVIRIHSEVEYRCYAVGFSPGFAYLGYLDDRIANLPRLPSPRKRVESGSVGITGRQTAVYPAATPGGWNLIGRCPLQLVDVDAGYFPIEAGDRVRFRRVDEAEFAKLKGERL